MDKFYVISGCSQMLFNYLEQLKRRMNNSYKIKQSMFRNYKWSCVVNWKLGYRAVAVAQKSNNTRQRRRRRRLGSSNEAKETKAYKCSLKPYKFEIRILMRLSEFIK